MQILHAASYEEEMRTIADPLLDSIRTSGIMPVKGAPEGEGIYYEIYATKDAKAAMVMSHGFSENTVKNKEIIYYMVMLYSIINPLKDFSKAGYNIPKGLASMERVDKILMAE